MRKHGAFCCVRKKEQTQLRCVLIADSTSQYPPNKSQLAIFNI
jgi:hypothetical protein